VDVSTKRILLVDDHAEFLEAAAEALAQEPDIEVVGTATTGEEALREAERLHPDVVLLDWSLPDMSGPKALQALKSRPDGPRVIMLTGHYQASYRAAAAQLGADGFVSKADFDAQLVDQIRQLFA
jgi:DNA-binding NarL/FixJ family response regulator